MEPQPIDTANKFLVAAAGERVIIQMPPFGLIDKEDALLLAAWIVAVADPEGPRFGAVLEAVRNA